MLSYLTSLGIWNWFIAAALLIVLEMIAPGAFMLWLGFAALAVGVISLVTTWAWQAQCVAFVVFAAALFPLYAATVVVAGAVALGVASMRMDGRRQAFVYPVITLALGLVFAAALAVRLLLGAIPRPETRVGAHTRRVAGGEVACAGACENVHVLDIGDNLAVDFTPAAATS